MLRFIPLVDMYHNNYYLNMLEALEQILNDVSTMDDDDDDDDDDQ